MSSVPHICSRGTKAIKVSELSIMVGSVFKTYLTFAAHDLLTSGSGRLVIALNYLSILLILTSLFVQD